MLNLMIMSKDLCVGRYADGKLDILNAVLLPLYLGRTGNVEGWLEQRAIDPHRANSRLLKKALRLENKDDISTVLQYNAATITDTYWVKSPDSHLTYDDVRFRENHFDLLALRGDPDSFNRQPSRTPELTNTGSFEKCWRLIDDKWWMYKSGNASEQFTELFSCHLAKVLGIPAAIYEKDGNYVRTLDFTDGASVNFETAFSIIGDEADYGKIYRTLKEFDSGVADAYVQMLFFDGLIFNMDRHEHNFGVLRDTETGKTLGLAPLYDHNIALITRGFPSDVSRKGDRLITDFIQLFTEESIMFSLPGLTEAMVDMALRQSASCFDDSSGLQENTASFVKEFVMNGYRRMVSHRKSPLISSSDANTCGRIGSNGSRRTHL